ncbi:MAG: flagellar motor stator protein MotA [Gemmatimonadota bacterium]
MIAIIGLIVVVASVLGGFAMSHGPFGVLLAYSEWVVICGTAAGTLIVATPGPIIKDMLKKIVLVFKKNAFTRELYIEALKLLYEMFQIARKDGLVAIESHIEDPEKSSVFKKYPQVLHQHHAVEFLCDSLRLVLVGSVPPHDLEAMMDAEIDVHHEREEKSVAALTKVGDSLPGIGIVAAVLGIVVTMQAINGPIEEIGHHVASALVGTFLGILLSYGFVAPIATNIELMNASETRFYHFLKASVVAFAKGFAPIVATEFARRAIFSDVKPTFQEMEAACKSATKKEKAA